MSDTSGHESVRSSDLDEGLVSFITTAQDESKDCSSINWLRFSGTNREDGWRAALNLASNGQTDRWYVGVTESPVRRMLGDFLRPATMTPHNRKYHCLYPLIVTRDAVAVEKSWILGLTSELGYFRRDNVGPGGEHVLVGATKFVYLCIRWRTVAVCTD